MRIALEERFTDVQLFDMFNVELATQKGYAPGAKLVDRGKEKLVDACKMPLWKLRKLPPGRGVKVAVQNDDFLREGVSIHPSGSDGRIADLVAYYRKREAGKGTQGETLYDEKALSAFTI